jgi:hypothetical protein
MQGGNKTAVRPNTRRWWWLEKKMYYSIEQRRVFPQPPNGRASVDSAWLSRVADWRSVLEGVWVMFYFFYLFYLKCVCARTVVVSAAARPTDADRVTRTSNSSTWTILSYGGLRDRHSFVWGRLQIAQCTTKWSISCWVCLIVFI